MAVSLPNCSREAIMLNITAVLGLATALALLNPLVNPARADDVTVEKTLPSERPADGALIIKDRGDTTGSIDRDCVKTKSKREDLATGEKEVKEKKTCD